MATQVIMPQLGESVAEGVVTEWLKQEGDQVKEDEPIAVVTTEKVTVDIPAPASGVILKLMVPQGATVAVEQPIAVIGQPGEKVEGAEAVPAAARPAAAKPAAPEPAKKPAEQPARRSYSPVVLRMAEEHGLDLGQIPGTGEGGRVTKKDVLAYLERPAAKAAVPSPTPAEAPPPAPRPPASKEGEELIPFAGMRREIAEHMARSVQTAAHVTTVNQVDMTRVAEWREREKDDFLEREGVKLTYLPFIARATLDAIAEFPILNSTLSGDQIAIKHYVNLGIAVSVDEGLMVPVIKNAHRMSLVELARAIEDLAGRAREKRLVPDDVQGGTFTITNPGVFGAVLSTPIIHQPQAAILSVEAIRKQPVVVDDAIAIRQMMNLCLSYDHRLMDGATAVRFLARVKQHLEHFDFLR